MDSEQTIAAPVLIRVISILLLLSGVLWIVFLFATIFYFGTAYLLANWSALVEALATIVLSVGLRKMRRWALYVYTTLAVLFVLKTALLLVSSTIDTSSHRFESFGGIAIAALILIYFWMHKKDFR